MHQNRFSKRHEAKAERGRRPKIDEPGGNENPDSLDVALEMWKSERISELVYLKTAINFLGNCTSRVKLLRWFNVKSMKLLGLLN